MTSLDFEGLFRRRPRERVPLQILPAPQLTPIARPVDAFARVSAPRPDFRPIPDLSGLSRLGRAAVGIVGELERREEAEDAALEASQSLLGPFAEQIAEARARRDAILAGDFDTAFALPEDAGFVMGSEGEVVPRPPALERTRKQIAKLSRNGILPSHKNPITIEVFNESAGAALAAEAARALEDRINEAAEFDATAMRFRNDPRAIAAEVFVEFAERFPQIDAYSPEAVAEASQKFTREFIPRAQRFIDKSEELRERQFLTAFADVTQTRFNAHMDATLEGLLSEGAIRGDPDALAKDVVARTRNLAEEMSEKSGVPVSPIDEQMRLMKGYIAKIVADTREDPLEREHLITEVLDVFRETTVGAGVKASESGRFQEEVEQPALDIIYGRSSSSGTNTRTNNLIDRAVRENALSIHRQLFEGSEDGDPANDAELRTEMRNQLIQLFQSGQAFEGISRPLSAREKFDAMQRALGEFDEMASNFYTVDPTREKLAAQAVLREALRGNIEDAETLLQKHMRTGEIQLGGNIHTNLVGNLRRIREGFEFVGEGSPVQSELRPLMRDLARLEQQGLPQEALGEIREAVDGAEESLRQGAIEEALRLRGEGVPESALPSRIQQWLRSNREALVGSAREAIDRQFERRDQAEALVVEWGRQQRRVSPEEWAELLPSLGAARVSALRRQHQRQNSMLALMHRFQPTLDRLIASQRENVRIQLLENDEFQRRVTELNERVGNAAGNLFLENTVTRLVGRMRQQMGEGLRNTLSDIQRTGADNPDQLVRNGMQQAADRFREQIGVDVQEILQENERERQFKTVRRDLSLLNSAALLGDEAKTREARSRRLPSILFSDAIARSVSDGFKQALIAGDTLKLRREGDKLLKKVMQAPASRTRSQTVYEILGAMGQLDLEALAQGRIAQSFRIDVMPRGVIPKFIFTGVNEAKIQTSEVDLRPFSTPLQEVTTEEFLARPDSEKLLRDLFKVFEFDIGDAKTFEEMIEVDEVRRFFRAQKDLLRHARTRRNP